MRTILIRRGLLLAVLAIAGAVGGTPSRGDALIGVNTRCASSACSRGWNFCLEIQQIRPQLVPMDPTQTRDGRFLTPGGR